MMINSNIYPNNLGYNITYLVALLAVSYVQSTQQAKRGTTYSYWVTIPYKDKQLPYLAGWPPAGTKGCSVTTGWCNIARHSHNAFYLETSRYIQQQAAGQDVNTATARSAQYIDQQRNQFDVLDRGGWSEGKKLYCWPML